VVVDLSTFLRRGAPSDEAEVELSLADVPRLAASPRVAPLRSLTLRLMVGTETPDDIGALEQLGRRVRVAQVVLSGRLMERADLIGRCLATLRVQRLGVDCLPTASDLLAQFLRPVLQAGLRALHASSFYPAVVARVFEGLGAAALERLELDSLCMPNGLNNGEALVEALVGPAAEALTTVRALALRGDDPAIYGRLTAAAVGRLASCPAWAVCEELDLSGNGLPGTALLPLFDASVFPRLTSLSLAGNTVDDATALAISESPRLTQLRTLDLSRNKIGPAGALLRRAAAERAPGLTLDLSGNAYYQSLGTSGPDGARVLNLQGRAIDRGGAGLLLRVVPFGQVRELALKLNGDDDEGPAALLRDADLAGLTALNLANSRLGTATALEAILRRFRLESLDLSDSLLTAEGLATLLRCPALAGLRALDLSKLRREMPGRWPERFDLESIADLLCHPLFANLTSLSLDGLYTPGRLRDALALLRSPHLTRLNTLRLAGEAAGRGLERARIEACLVDPGCDPSAILHAEGLHELGLLRGVLAAPDDDAARLVYADWLTDRDDPRGDSIRRQCAAADSAQDGPAAWAGGLTALLFGEFPVTFRRGFVEEARLTNGPSALSDEVPLLAALQPLHRLDVMVVRNGEEARALEAAACLPWLRWLTLDGQLHEGDPMEMDLPRTYVDWEGRRIPVRSRPHFYLEDPAALAPRLAGLRGLTLRSFVVSPEMRSRLRDAFGERVQIEP
jgi:uncharacterized protein (TIGR02996 family)